MEVYILDSLFRRIDVIDNFDSLIWTERFSSYGDFELIMHSTLENRNRFKVDTRLAMNESYRVMTVETVEDTTDDEGRAILKIKGPSLEEILDDRIARGSLSDLTTESKWSLTGTPGAIARYIFHNICVLGTLHVADIIPLVIEGTIFPDDNIEEPDSVVTIEFEPMTVYQAIKNVCEVYNLGFRLVRNFDASQLYFDVYAGSDRTTQQSVLPAVVFSPELDNLNNRTELTTIASYKNVAYVISPVGHQIVYSPDINPDTAGLDRHVVLVKADDITDEVPATATAKMIQRGLEELAKYRIYSAFDGEINQHSNYKYGTDYNLGDLIEVRNIDGATNNMRVTEQIFVSDKEGERSYPTLSVAKFITPGVWSAWEYNDLVWTDFGSTEYWADQP